MSVSKLAKRRGQILDEIMRYHREQLPKLMRAIPQEDLRALALVAPHPLDFYAVLNRPGVGLIAECKKASPSKGLIDPHYHPVELARDFVRGGAGAVSVLTDARHFQGSLDDLRNVKEALSHPKALLAKNDPRLETGIPILRKDFIFHPYQIHEARAAGADAVLLIAAVLSDSDLKELLALTHELSMNALVEVHTEAEVERVLPLQPRIIAINNRNLQTFKVDFSTSARLLRLIPPHTLTVAASGIQSPEDVRQMRQIGVNAVLVGESLVKSKNRSEAARALVKAGAGPSSLPSR
jgi:indole-3-glycerol phosphate synthase